MERTICWLLSIQVIILIVMSNVFIIPGSGDDSVNIVSVSPTVLFVSPQQSFTLSVHCQPVQPIKSFELSICFDAALLQVNEVVEGDFFSGYPTFFNSGTIDNSDGLVTSIYGLIIGPGSVTEEGDLVTISFTAKDNFGSSEIRLMNVGLTNETEYVSVSLVNGLVTIQNQIPIVENEVVVFSDPLHTNASFGWIMFS